MSFDLFVHPHRDPGCLNEAHKFLRPFYRSYDYALVLLDHEGCGRESQPPAELAEGVTQELERAGWRGRAAAVVISPELEVWVWTSSPHVDLCLGWEHGAPALRQWLEATGRWPAESQKPAHPKEAMEAALRQVNKPRSSFIYRQLAERVSLLGHDEPAFCRLTGTLRQWFPSPA